MTITQINTYEQGLSLGLTHSALSSGAKRVALNALEAASQSPAGSRGAMFKRYAFHIASLDLFAAYSPMLALDKTTISLSAFVLQDGLGDYFSLLTQASNLKQQHPNLQIFLLIDFLDFKRRSKNLERPDPALFSYAFVEGNIVHEAHSCRGREIDEPQGWLRQELDKSQWILQVGFLKARPRALAQAKVYGLQEYGLFNQVKTIGPTYMGMGVGRFDLGLNLPARSVAGIPSVQQRHVGYFSGDALDYTKAMFMITSWSLGSKERDQEIILKSEPAELISFLGQNSIKSLAGQLGIQKIIVYQQETIECAPTGRVVEITNPFPLPRQDFMELMATAAGPLGCTGDLSFSEAIQVGIPFYQIRSEKTPFVQDLIQFAREVGTPSEAQAVAKYFGWLQAMHNVDGLDLELHRINELIVQSRQILQVSIFKNLASFFAKLRQVSITPYVSKLLCQTLLLQSRPDIAKLYRDYQTKIAAASPDEFFPFLQQFGENLALQH